MERAQDYYRQVVERGLPEPLGITGAMNLGNSGGPVYHRSDGSIVGMAIILDPSYNRTFIVPAISILEAIEEAGLAH